MAGVYNFVVRQGSDKTLSLIYEDKNGLVDLTSKTAAMQLRKEVNSSDVLDFLSTENGRITFEETTKNGETKLSKINLIFPNSVSSQYKFKECVYDLEIYTDMGGGETHVKRLIEGKIFISFEVTRIEF